MKFIGNDGVVYDTQAECEKADVAFAEAEELRKAAEAEKSKKNIESKKKKELAEAVDKADEELKAATLKWNKAKEDAYKLRKEAEEKATQLLYSAAREREKAAANKMEAIKKFTETFGPYTKYLTGNKAVEEYNSLVESIKDLFDLYIF